jgi:poly(glycerol-phosphate) alpha-glucosyltransferase
MEIKTTTVVGSVSRKAGGLQQSVRRLHQCLNELPEVSVTIFTLKDEYTDADLHEWHPLPVNAFPARGPRAFGYSPALRRNLLRVDADILHTHGIWQYPSVAVTACHRQTRKPYLISPHGMLDPWAVKNSAWKKRLALMFYEREHLENAACIRALCEAEAGAIRQLDLKNPIAIIPNGIDPPDLSEARSAEGMAHGACHFAAGRKVLLYLGRIHPKKGLVNLLRAWAVVQKAESRKQKAEEWVLAIAGWDQGGHEKELRMLSAECGIQDSVVFLGPKFGDDKAACFRDCDAFILPSFSEGLPMVILEAWAHGKPVVMTPECNLPEGFAANAAFRIEPGVESIARGLRELFRTPQSTLRDAGDNGCRLAVTKFAWPKVAADMKSVYEWVLGGGAKPDCVVES